jgi:hypothetical protein
VFVVGVLATNLVPGGHAAAVAVVQDGAFAVVEKVPDAHAAQPSFAVAVPGVTDWPGTQPGAVHALHEGAFAVVEYVPAAQAWQP